MKTGYFLFLGISIFLFISMSGKVDAAIMACGNDSDCVSLNGISYSCVNPGTNVSYCAISSLCGNDSDCVGKDNPCCGSFGICDSKYACSSDEDCVNFQGKSYECINPGTCQSFCYPKGYCNVSTDCMGELYPCCSDRGKCELNYLCSTDDDCAKFSDSAYHCEYAGTCSSYCELDSKYADIADKRCNGFAGDYPTMDKCLSSCMKPKDCFLNYTTRCFECAKYENLNDPGTCMTKGMFDAQFLCERSCKSKGHDCYYDTLSGCWNCIEVSYTAVEMPCDKKNEYANPAECNLNCGFGRCYRDHTDGCFECIGKRKQINLRGGVEEYDFHELINCTLPYPLSILHGNDRVLVTDRSNGKKYVLVIENAVIKEILDEESKDVNIYMSIKNTQVVKDFLKSKNQGRYYKEARAANYITIEPADFWSYLKVILTNILLSFV